MCYSARGPRARARAAVSYGHGRVSRGVATRRERAARARAAGSGEQGARGCRAGEERGDGGRAAGVESKKQLTHTWHRICCCTAHAACAVQRRDAVRRPAQTRFIPAQREGGHREVCARSAEERGGRGRHALAGQAWARAARSRCREAWLMRLGPRPRPKPYRLGAASARRARGDRENKGLGMCVRQPA
jgi:hypothetical protein